MTALIPSPPGMRASLARTLSCFVSIACLSLSWSLPAAAQDDGSTCVPACRQGFICHQGRCIEACNPPCEAGRRCTDAGECVAQAPTGHAAPIVGAPTGADPARPLDDGYFALGFGSDVGEGYGGAIDIELGTGSPGSYVDAILSLMVGRSWGDSLNVIPSLAVGWRGISQGGGARLTGFLGPEVAFMVELDDAYDERYDYLIPWARAAIGFLSPWSTSGFWGLEATANLGYRVHINADENPWDEDYSGFSGMFRVRFRTLF